MFFANALFCRFSIAGAYHLTRRRRRLRRLRVRHNASLLLSLSSWPESDNAAIAVVVRPREAAAAAAADYLLVLLYELHRSHCEMTESESGKFYQLEIAAGQPSSRQRDIRSKQLSYALFSFCVANCDPFEHVGIMRQLFSSNGYDS